MSNNPQAKKGISRRDSLKLSALALGGLTTAAFSSKYNPAHTRPVGNCYPTTYKTEQYSYFNKLPLFDPSTPMEKNEMRISFLGSCIPPVRRAQQMMSVFVQVGDANGKGEDQAVFDCGSGVCANYGAMGIPFSKMDKIFLAHLHGDHMSDLTHIYCFGPSGDRKSPLYVWGHGPSGVTNPASVPELHLEGYDTKPTTYPDGTATFCAFFREAMRWHTESFSFLSTRYEECPTPEEIQAKWGLKNLPLPVGDDPYNDGFALVPIELDWQEIGGVAYNNQDTGLKITHFPVEHCRRGSMGYKVEWNGLSMVYTSDTKPETNCLAMGKGTDVFIHEMVVPPDVWAMKNQGLTQPGDPNDPYWNAAVQGTTDVQNSSHTPQGAFGYLMSQLNPRPRLTVATHFPVADDTVDCALRSVQAHCPEIRKVGDGLIWSFDLMVLRVFPDKIIQCRADVNNFGFSPVTNLSGKTLMTPKYHSGTDCDPYYQLDRQYEIPPSYTDDKGNTVVNYRTDGY